jgi:uncharacterized membrane protein
LEDDLRRKKRSKTITGAVGLFVAVLVLVIHFFVMDLDILWAKVSRRLTF